MKKILVYVVTFIIFTSCFNLRSNFILRPKIVGIVYDRETLEPISDVLIRFSSDTSLVRNFSNEIQYNTDSNGLFTFGKIEIKKSFYEQDL